MDALDLSWCPTCAAWTCADVGTRCAWCDTVTVRKRGGWKRPDRHAFTRPELETIAALHQRGHSLRAIARGLYERRGYASEGSCLESIRAGMRREGLSVRRPGAATAACNRARRQRPAGESTAAYKRRMRRERGYRDTRTGEWRRVEA